MRINIREVQREKFYRLPKELFTNPKYKKLGSNTKIAYSILLDRLELSIKNEWVDENGDIFFYFTYESLMDTMDISGKATISKIKKELNECGLLEEVRQGLNKPNKLYLNYVDVVIPTEVQKVNFQKFKKCNSNGSSKSELPEVQKVNGNYTYNNNTEINYTDNNKEVVEPDPQNGGVVISEMEKELVNKTGVSTSAAKKILRHNNNDLENILYWYEESKKSNTINSLVAYLCKCHEYQIPTKKTKQDNFNNFEQRKYDYDSLERKLLGWD